MNNTTVEKTTQVVGSVLTTYASTYFELKERQQEIAEIKSNLASLDNKVTTLQSDNKILTTEVTKIDTKLGTIEQTLIAMDGKLNTVVSERKWYKTAAGFVIAASTAIIAFILFLITYSSEITAIKEILNQLIELNK